MCSGEESPESSRLFQEMLEKSIELCRFPPAPDAVCRLEKCLCPLKAEIYFTDPDFKVSSGSFLWSGAKRVEFWTRSLLFQGYIQICCCQSCKVEFHISCWKSLKSTKFSEKNEKVCFSFLFPADLIPWHGDKCVFVSQDVLNEACLTPDCLGKICSIRIFGPTGLVKCKVRNHPEERRCHRRVSADRFALCFQFETTITKPELLKKPRVNQKATRWGGWSPTWVLFRKPEKWLKNDS